MLVCCLILFSLFNNIQSQEFSNKIYIAKSSWHVGIILKVDADLLLQIDALKDFGNFGFVDIGWGDAEFYQSPSEFDLYLAAKAILFPTPSVVRVQGYDS